MAPTIEYDDETLKLVAKLTAERDLKIVEARRLFHALWGKAVDVDQWLDNCPAGYVKEEWAALQSLLSDLLGTAI